jgi:hypothetical protein
LSGSPKATGSDPPIDLRVIRRFLRARNVFSRARHRERTGGHLNLGIACRPPVRVECLHANPDNELSGPPETARRKRRGIYPNEIKMILKADGFYCPPQEFFSANPINHINPI